MANLASEDAPAWSSNRLIRRDRRLSLKADELSPPHSDLRQRGPFVSRPPGSTGRVRHRVPLGTIWEIGGLTRVDSPKTMLTCSAPKTKCPKGCKVASLWSAPSSTPRRRTSEFGWDFEIQTHKYVGDADCWDRAKRVEAASTRVSPSARSLVKLRSWSQD